MLRKFFLFQLLFWFVAFNISTGHSVVINEYMASNGSTNQDAFGVYDDWIELYNTTDSVVDLKDFHLSDDADNITRWQIPESLVIPPGEHQLVWASGRDTKDDEGYLHANFRISRTGEPLFLVAPDGNTIIDKVASRHVPRDHSFGRKNDGGGEWVYFKNPTPEGPNNPDGYEEFLDKPEFSHEAGFYENAFYLEISHEDPDATIYYTLDGSEPDLENVGEEAEDLPYHSRTYIYDEPILIRDRSRDSNALSNIRTTHDGMPDHLVWKEPSDTVFKGRVVRAQAKKEGALPSKGDTRNYYITPEGDDRYDLPVISVTGDNEHFFGHDRGIYVGGQHAEGSVGHWGLMEANFQQRGRDWERPGHKQLIEPDGEVGVSQNVGYRIHGNVSRAQPLKSLRVYSRADYHPQRTFQYDMFDGAERSKDDEVIDEFNRLILRNSGQDFYHTYDDDWPYGTMLKDAVAQTLMKHTSIGYQRYRPAVHFINGEFWGIINIRERYDRFHVKYNYEIPEEDVVIYDAENRQIGEGTFDDYMDYIDMRDFVLDNDMSEEENYDSIKTLLDLDSYIDYYVNQLQSGHRHVASRGFEMWRKRTSEIKDEDEVPYGHDGRWRYKVYDLDRAFHPTTNTLQSALDPSNDNNSVALRKMVENDDFRDRFLNRMSDHLNSTYDKERVKNFIDEKTSRLEPVIEEHTGRWGYPDERSTWEETIEEVKHWADRRPHVQREHFKKHLDADTAQLTVDVNDPFKGHVEVNTLPIKEETIGIHSSPYPWNGIYFTDVKLPVKAEPAPGHTFERWAGTDITDKEIEVPFDSDTTLKAIYSTELTFPDPFNLGEENFLFPESASLDSLPRHKDVYFYSNPHPDRYDQMAGNWIYGLDERSGTGITLNEEGLGFKNTDEPANNVAYAGASVLALDTREAEEAYLEWSAGTREEGELDYELRLEYRTEGEGNFRALTGQNDDTLVYRTGEEEDLQTFGPVEFPDSLMDNSNLQLRWNFVRSDQNDSGESPKVKLYEINVFNEKPQAPDIQPILESPENNSDDILTETTLQWQGVEKASSYQVQVSEDSNFSSPVFDEAVGASQYEIENLSSGRTYHWRVRAENNFGQSDWSDVWTFNTQTTLTPDPVRLSEPVDNALISEDEDETTFSWHGLQNAEEYNLEVAADPQFNEVERHQTLSDTITQVVWSDDIIEPRDTLYWRVNAENDYGQGLFSNSRSFIADEVSRLHTLKDDAEVRVSPNPFNEEVTFEIASTKSASIELVIWNGQGIIQANEILDGSSGEAHFIWRPDDPAKGVYYYRLSGEGFNETGKLIKH